MTDPPFGLVREASAFAVWKWMGVGYGWMAVGGADDRDEAQRLQELLGGQAVMPRGIGPPSWSPGKGKKQEKS